MSNSFGEYYDEQNERLRKMMDNKDRKQHMEWQEEYNKRHEKKEGENVEVLQP
tara:strand:- start:846 stop:1004 length:159 start_codon:yes stop_codon:yes gene_type:complete